MSGAVRYWAVNTVQYSGLVTTSVANMVDLTATGTAAVSPSVTSSAWGPTNQANEVLVAAVRNSSGSGVFTPDTGYAIAEEDLDAGSAIQDQIVSATQSGGSTVSMSYSSSVSWVMVFASFKETGGGGGASRTGTMLQMGMGR
jgi:hypothetical protein